MAKTVTTTLQVSLSGDGYGGGPLYASSVANFAGGPPSSWTLASGNTVFAVPAGAQGVTIVLPPGNTVQVTLKGVSGDTGLLLHLTSPTSIAFAAGQAVFSLNAAAPVAVGLIWQ